jgi:DNA-binding SARP family transcriptional activator/tetratricopeptide (TPR) repeat protein
VPVAAEYGLLGPLTVRRGGAVIEVTPGKQQVVLAALLLRAGRLAGVDELAEALWGAQPPPSARESLQNYVARLRRALGADGNSVIVTGPGGYRIEVRPGELDADRFEAALAAGRAAAREGAWARAAGVLREGLALWRGEPLAGVDSEVLAARDGLRLAELRWQATEALLEADLQLGRHGEVIAGLRQLTAEQPLRERLHVLLMTALYRDGQQAAALAAYRAARSVLVAELSAGPGPELQALHQQILNAGPAPAGPAPAGPAPAGPAPAGREPAGPDVRYSLPPDTALFTGRDAELDTISAAVASAAVAGAAAGGGVVAIRAIGGMPGVGKTALAVHAAHQLASRFPDRQLLVNLHGHTPGQDPVTPEDALAGLLSATGVDPRDLPGDLAGRAALWRDRMAGQKALLVLDNAASSAQVAPLLPGAAGCLVLVTSRRHLGDLPDAVPVLLEALPPGQAAEMFLRLAPRAVGSPDEAVAELTELAGFLPLAISLLARVYAGHPSWTLADLAAQTRASLLSRTAERDSVSAAFEVSYRCLPPARQQFFRALGLHPGTTTDARAAAALAGVPLDEAAAHLDALHGEGMITETGYRRYGMHDLIRRYARNHAAAGPADDAERALERLLDYYQHAAARAESLLSRQTRPGLPPAAPAGLPAAPDLDDEGQALAWARAERATLLACFDHAAAAGQDARLTGLTAGLAGLLRRDGPWADAITRHAAAARAAQRLGDRAGQAGALGDLGAVRQLTGDYPAAAQALEQALRIYRDLGDRRGQANAVSELGVVRMGTGDYRAAAQALEQALDFYRDLGDRRGQAGALNNLGVVRLRTGDYLAAARVQKKALRICRDLGNRRGQANALICLGVVGQQTGDYPAAARALEQALAIYRDLGDRLGQANAFNYLGVVWQLTGDYRAAAQALEHALGISRDLGDRGGEAEALNGRGTVHRLSGEPALAEGCHQQALELARAIASSWDEGHALAGLGRCALAADHTTRAGALLRQALEIFQRIGAAEAPGLAAELAALDSRPPAQ